MKAETSSNGWSGMQFNDRLAVKSVLLLVCLAAVNGVAQTRSNGLASAVTGRGCAARQVATIPFPEIGARATANYQGDVLGVTATAEGARLRCGFQKLEGHATSEGLWLESTQPGAAGRLRVTATALSRGDLSTLNPQPSTVLPTTGTVCVADKLVRFTRPGLTEEYSVSVDGVRQDFIIESPPLNPQPSTLNQSMRVELALSGPGAEAIASGVRLRLEGSGRALAYGRLRVVDAAGRELSARLEVLSADRLAVSVADANATYPVRIDPTFSDADWVSLNPGTPGANGPVWAIAVDGSGNVYVGGEFTFVGTVPVINIAKWDGSAWSALDSGISGPPPSLHYSCVNALAVSGTNLYAGGQFTIAGTRGVSANNVARWDGQAWSALGDGIGGYYIPPFIPTNPPEYFPGVVRALATSGSHLYAAGEFGSAGGIYATNIAEWNGSAWSALGSGIGDCFSQGVYALTLSGTDLYAGGAFSRAGGQLAPCIAKWDGSAWSALGSGMNTYVWALAADGSDLYAGGRFTTAGGVPENCIAKWNGSAWSALGSGMNGDVYALVLSGTNLYAGGTFTTAGGVTANNTAKWDGRAWSRLGSGVNNQVQALAVSGTDLYAGAGSGYKPIAKWDGSAWSALGSGINDAVEALAVSGCNLYAGGEFITAGEVWANYIAKWDGSAWSALGSGMNEVVNALVVSGTNLYAGGYFTKAGGVAANYIAKWDGHAWSALGSGMNNEVQALAVSGTNLYAGGGFTMAGGVPANGIAKWNGSSWSALGSGVNDQVWALAVNGNDLYAGGQFATAGGVPANNIAICHGGVWSALGSGMQGTVSALAVSGTSLYAGGYFTTAGGVPANNIAKWDGTAWSALGSGLPAFNPGAGVCALAVSGTDLYAGLYSIESGIAKWDGSDWSGLGSGVSSSQGSYVKALAADGAGHLFVGGWFSLAGTNVAFYIAQANVDSIPTILSPPESQTAEVGAVMSVSASATGYPSPTYQWLFNGHALAGCTQSTLCLSGVQATNVGAYSVVVSNRAGAVTSAPAMLNVVPRVERRPVPGVRLSGASGSLLNVDYANTLSPMPAWNPLGFLSLTSPPQYCFDLTLPLPPQRFYRAWQAGTPGVRPSLDLHLVPAITLTGTIGHSVRLDYINQFGPTDAWVTLATVPLTNTSQLYFDTAAPGQPQRLYRLVPSP